jgi:hypothetical protein
VNEIIASSLETIYGLGDDEDSQTISALCKKTGKWGMYVCLGHKPGEFPDNIDEYIGAAPYLKYPANETVLVNGFGYFLFDHRDDLDYAFDVTVGDNGPTMWNDYDGPASVYALTCGPDGVELDENT